MTNFMRDWHSKSVYRQALPPDRRADWWLVAGCVVYALVLVALDWLASG